ncbi:MAG: VWA domain-containing protein [Deltaproteobacteria bacterium]|nr:VWA domain-containing protein [Deltaproteobacteria bacterium]
MLRHFMVRGRGGDSRAVLNFDDTYLGLSKSEALDVAKAYYDHGVYPEAFLRVLNVEDRGGGTWRATVTVTEPDGRPAENLTPADFTVSTNGGDAAAPATATTVAQLSEDDLDLRAPIVVDDSGSITDCDAKFVADGLGYLYGALPHFYEFSLIKFGSNVRMVQDWTSDADALAAAQWNLCENGLTSLWDALDLALGESVNDGRGLDVVFLFSDGVDNDSAKTVDNVIAQSQQKNVPVFTVALGFADIFALGKLALATHGGLVYVPHGEKVLQGFETLTAFILKSYVIEWTADESVVSIEITADLGEDGTVSGGFSK